jgi:hypothetical protein
MHIDSTLTCTDDLTGLTNDNVLWTLYSRAFDTILSTLKFDICGFTGVIIVVINTNFKLVWFLR